jgi:signal peptidase I
MNWEMIGWIAIASSLAVIVASFFTGKDSLATNSGQSVAAQGADSPSTTHIMLEIAWPVLFIASLAMLTFREVMGFSAILLLATLITGAVWLVDSLLFRKRRAANAHDPVLVEMAKSFFPVILIVFLLRSFLYEPFKIPSGSMEPTLLVGDFILVNKYTFGVRIPVINKRVMDVNLPARGDVMVFRYPVDTSKDYIKRVVGLPGDEISYKNKQLSVNGTLVPVTRQGTYTETSPQLQIRFFETFTEKLGDKPHAMMVDPRLPAIDLGGVGEFPNKSNCTYNDAGLTCRVPDGHYFMMGDSRDNSQDSRVWGFVPEQNIVGKAVLVWMNFGNLKRIGTRIE